MPDSVDVEIVFALADHQELVSLSVDEGTTVADVVSQSGLSKKFPEQDLSGLQVGIWGRIAERNYRVKQGDRVELYRSLNRDPRDARRELALSGLTMREQSDD